MRKALLVLLILALASPCHAKYSGGTGDANDPYQMANVADLMTLANDANDYNKCFLMTADIDLDPCLPGNQVFTNSIIAKGISVFTGKFNGDGHTIANLTIECNNLEHIGLFGNIGGLYKKDAAEINNLTLLNAHINAGTGIRVGTLVGEFKSGTINNCSAIGGNVYGGQTVGGLIGYFSGIWVDNTIVSNCNTQLEIHGISRTGGLIGESDGNVINCCSNSNIIASGMVGGLIGRAAGKIEDCNSKGTISGTSDYLGGLVGYGYDLQILNSYSEANVTGASASMKAGGLVGEFSGDLVSGCIARGNVTAGRLVGGLVGELYSVVSDCYAAGQINGDYGVGGLAGDNSHGTITRSYAAGKVTGNTSAGGLVGGAYQAKVEDSFWDINATGQTTSAQGTGKNTAEMRELNTFIAWTCSTLWRIDDGLDYPRLDWENTPGELISETQWLGGGTGEPNDPFLIYTVEQLNTINRISCYLSRNFKLMADIDLNSFENQFNIIGASAKPFTGTFNGNGFVISNFRHTNNSTNSNLGLFGYVSGCDARIENLGLESAYIYVPNSSNVGCLAGYLDSGSVINCFCEEIFIKARGSAGGLIGIVSNGEVTSCHLTGSINNSASAGNYFGGIAGVVSGGLVSQSYAVADLNCSNLATGVGGIAGLVNGYGIPCTARGYEPYQVMYPRIERCYSSGNIRGQKQAGGLIGLIDASITGTGVFDSYSEASVSGSNIIGGLVGKVGTYSDINHCYSAGLVVGDTNTGGLTGAGSNIIDSFWDINTSGQSYSSGGTGKTTIEMHMQSTFTSAGWDFVWETANGPNDVWAICEGVSYPKLAWQFVVGDSDNDKDVNFIDFAALGNKWMQADSNLYCGGADLTGDGWVDLDDLAAFANNWLQ
jgi:hypothetical protein